MTEVAPHLAFGERVATHDFALADMQERIAKARGWEPEYRSTAPDSTFFVKTATARLGGLMATAIAHSPIESRVVSPNFKEIVIPVAGEVFHSSINGVGFTAGPGANMLFLPEGERIGRGGGYRSVVFLQIDASRFQHTASVMLGQTAGKNSRFDLNSAHVIASQIGSFNFESSLLELCRVMDQFITAPAALDRLGLDESIYRLLVLATHPRWALGVESPAKSATMARVNLVCDYVMAHLDQPLTLTDLEHIAALSARALQYAFQNHYGSSPMQWVRQARLQAARQRLITARECDSVTSIALACGMPRLGAFAASYRGMFGESPSATLARALRN